MKLLIIRPQPGADATAARVRASGHEPILLPLFAAQAIDWEIGAKNEYDGILITSANAIRLAGEKLSDFAHLPVYAVGQNSADAAIRFGLQVNYTGFGGVDDVLEHIPSGKILWLAGEDRTEFSVPEILEIDCRVVYRSRTLPIAEDFADKLLDSDFVLLHSARAARFFSSLVSDKGIEKTGVSIAALSDKIAQAAGGGWNQIRVAPSPSDGELLSQI